MSGIDCRIHGGTFRMSEPARYFDLRQATDVVFPQSNEGLNQHFEWQLSSHGGAMVGWKKAAGKVGIVLMAVLLLCGYQSARQTSPKPSRDEATRSSILPVAYRDVTLSSGLRVVFAEHKTNPYVVTVTTIINSGSATDPPGKEWGRPPGRTPLVPV